MNSAFIVVVLLAIVMSVCSEEPNEGTECSKLPTTLSHDARVTVEPYGGRWKIVKSTHDITCLNFQYFGNLNGDENAAAVMFINNNASINADGQIFVNSQMTMWTLKQGRQPAVQYRKLLLNKEEHYFCLYSCDKEDVADVLCFALCDDGAEKITKDLATQFPNLRMKKDVKIMDSFPKTCKNMKANAKDCPK